MDSGAAIQLIVMITLVAVGLVLPVPTSASTPFGVRVPPDRVTAPVVVLWRRTYWVGVLAFGAITTLASVAAAADHVTAIAIATPVVLVASFLVLYLLAHRAVLAAKSTEDWFADSQPATAADTDLRTAPERYPWTWLAPALLVIAITAVYGAVRYGDLPSRLAVHHGADGQPDRFLHTSAATAFLPVYAQLGLTVLIALLARLALRAPTTLDPADPQRAARLFRTAGAALARALLFLAAAVCLGLFFLAQHLWRQSGTDTAPVLLAALTTAAGIVAVMATAARVGRAARLGAQETPRAPRFRDDDANWRGGLIYVNRDDPALLVPKRFGVGWTLNFGRPAAWLALGVILAIPVITALLATFV
ncbi:Uncharacterized membrane protein [Asanoa hainanensis]|uniref:Uncharacterized membrane protein n=1 Tax=Asanoa hainanensis TaxID=560556 RepID=A0A239PEN6_9ACTN|nr:DUF5808 domain-containing protein [Asanoa hainanensis]SNT65500.1 Uncharacterized membrane protein [Asanoa hainanensis]